MSDPILKANNYYNKGLKLKDEALINYPNNIHLFDEAAHNFLNAKNYLINSKSKDNLVKCFIDYYESEYHDCLSGKYYMILRTSGDANDMDKAIAYNKKRKNTLQKAYDQITKISDLSYEQENMKNDWKLALELTDLMTYIIRARYYFVNKKFVEAKDFYEEYLNKIERKIQDIDSSFDLRRKRIYSGNIIGMKFNAVQMLAGVYLKLNEQHKMIEKFIECYELAEKAFETNPEQKQYLQGQQIIGKNIKKYLTEKRNEWPKILAQNNSKIIRKLMIDVDLRKYLQTNYPFKVFSKYIYPFITLIMPFLIILCLFKSIKSALWTFLLGCLLFIFSIFLNILLLRKDAQLEEHNFFELTKIILKSVNLVSIVKETFTKGNLP